MVGGRGSWRCVRVVVGQGPRAARVGLAADLDYPPPVVAGGGGGEEDFLEKKRSAPKRSVVTRSVRV